MEKLKEFDETIKILEPTIHYTNDEFIIYLNKLYIGKILHSVQIIKIIKIIKRSKCTILNRSFDTSGQINVVFLALCLGFTKNFIMNNINILNKIDNQPVLKGKYVDDNNTISNIVYITNPVTTTTNNDNNDHIKYISIGLHIPAIIASSTNMDGVICISANLFYHSKFKIMKLSTQDLNINKELITDKLIDNFNRSELNVRNITNSKNYKHFNDILYPFIDKNHQMIKYNNDVFNRLTNINNNLINITMFNNYLSFDSKPNKILTVNISNVNPILLMIIEQSTNMNNLLVYLCQHFDNDELFNAHIYIWKLIKESKILY